VSGRALLVDLAAHGMLKLVRDREREDLLARTDLMREAEGCAVAGVAEVFEGRRLDRLLLLRRCEQSVADAPSLVCRNDHAVICRSLLVDLRLLPLREAARA